MKLITPLLFAHVSASRLLARDAPWNYLGETPPEDTPKPFPLPTSPGNFAAERIAISHDQRAIYYTELNGYNADSVNRLLVLTYEAGKWSAPALVHAGRGLLAPAFVSDESRLLLDGSIAELNVNGWSNPTSFRCGEKCHYLQQTRTGRIYFSVANKEGTEWDIVRAALPGSGAVDEKLGFNIAMHPPFAGFDMDFFIAPDESYVILMLTGARDFPCAGASDLFIAFSKPGGRWTKPCNLGAAVNQPDPKEWRWSPCVTDDREYLFFTRDDGKGARIYWVRFDHLRERLKRANE
jgi:hypothetical protein